MYKQCFELLTAQGPKPHKSFSVAHGTSDVVKEFDSEIKGNIFSLSGHRIQLPPNPTHLANNADFHNTGAKAPMASKKASVTASLNVVHQFLVFQIYVPQDEQFNFEIHIRDKHNSRRRLMFCDGTKSIVTNQMHARIPNAMVPRDCWVNLCIDVNSFIRECFTRNQPPYGTPQVQSNQPFVVGQRAIGGGSGDIAALHAGKVGDITGVQIQKATAGLSKNSVQNSQSNLNSLKTIEAIQLEGTFKIRKIFTSRSQIPADTFIENPFGNGGPAATAMSGGNMRAEDVINAAIVGQRIEQIPKNFDFGQQVERVNQVLSYEVANGFIEQRVANNSVEDSMMVTGLRMTSNTQNSAQGFHNNSVLHQHNDAPIDTYSNDPRSYHGNYLNPGSIKKSGSTLKAKASLRVHSNERNSVGSETSSPFPQGGIIGNHLSINQPSQQLDNSFRKANKQSNSSIQKNSVMIVDQEQKLQQNTGLRRDQNQTLRNSAISILQGPNTHAKQMKIFTGGMTEGVNDPMFKQANSTTSNHGQRSNQTQSTAYSVRTTSSGNQKSKLMSNGGNLQTSQSPFADNHSGGMAFSAKRSLHQQSNGRPVYEQVDEMEESGSGQISQQMLDQQESQDQNQGVTTADKNNMRMKSPNYSSSSSHVAQSAKITRKGIPKANVELIMPSAQEKLQMVLKNTDQVTTPKLSQLQEVHQTTILEENETMRGSIDRYPGSKLNNLHAGGSQTNQKKYNKIQQIEQKKVAGAAHYSAAGARKVNGPGSGLFGKNSRTKSSIAGSGQTIVQNDSVSHPLVQGKSLNPKVSMSSANLIEGIGGIVGNKIQSRQSDNKRMQNITNNSFQNKSAVSPIQGKKNGIPKNQLQLSAQKNKFMEHQPQFQVRNAKHAGARSNIDHVSQATSAQFIYNGTGYGSHHMQHGIAASAAGNMSGAMDSDGEQSDFKTTTLRFTNNNFINTEIQRRDRDLSQGATSAVRGENNGTIQGAATNMMSTLNSQNNQQVQSIAMQNRRNSKQFGTSDNFKASHGPSVYQVGYDQRTMDNNYSRLNNTQSKSPVNQQFSTMQGMMQSDGPRNDADFGEEEEEEQIEEDICDYGEHTTPLVNAKTKQETGQKAKTLFHVQHPPQFRSTESERFNLDTAMSGFGNNVNNGGAAGAAGFGASYINNKDRTPVADKSSILAKKPFLGGKPRKNQQKSPIGNQQQAADDASVYSELKQPNNNHDVVFRESEEDIVGLEDNYGDDQQIDQSQEPIDPEDTCTSDFYQVPKQGEVIPVQLTIDHGGRRPFTPPFAQLVTKDKPPTGRNPIPITTEIHHPKKMPEWVKPAASSNTGVMSNEQKQQLKQEVLLIENQEPTMDAAGEQDIESAAAAALDKIRKDNKQSQPATTLSKEISSDTTGSRNQYRQYHTFAEEQIEHSITLNENASSQPQVQIDEVLNRRATLGLNDLPDPTGSITHTFGRRSSNRGPNDEYFEENQLRANTNSTLFQQQETATIGGVQALQTQETTKKSEDVMDTQMMVEQKKRLLYDKSLKAYYDPETGEYFEMKAQLISQASLSQFEPATNQ